MRHETFSGRRQIAREVMAEIRAQLESDGETAPEADVRAMAFRELRDLWDMQRPADFRGRP